tara:strand:- start:239 stop:985 length:747 start_codon:yes stop_codon:yes gene_type:complete
VTNLFDAISRYYDLLYEEKDSLSESRYVDSLLRKYGSQVKSILEFGSGTGRHASHFVELGYQVHGIERSSKMVNNAKNIEGFICEQGDITKFDLRREFDAIISLFHVFSYQIENSQVQSILNNARKHLIKGGLFIFDVWYSPAVIFQEPSLRVKRLSNSEISITRIAEPISYPNENKVEVNYTFFVQNKNNGEYQTFTEKHPMRHFSIPELEFFASQSGFKLIKTEEWLTGESPSEKTWGVCFVLEKT